MPIAGSTKVRVEAARVIARVLSGNNLDTALSRADTAEFSPQQNSLLRALSYGVLRDYALLNALLTRMMEKPLNNEPELHSLILAGLFQLRSMRVATHAAVNETVEAVALMGKDKLRGLVNAILRRYQREREELEAQIPPHPAKQFSYPSWLADQVEKDWPDHWQTVLAAGSEQGPLTLRVNRRHHSAGDYLLQLQAAGLSAHTTPHTADALILDTAVPVNELPGFASGEVSVQDAAAQLATDLLAAKPGMRVLDACAAPGGKTAHLLERCGDLKLLALDQDQERAQRINDNLQRLQLKAEVAIGDATRPSLWWDERPFDRILLDAPCSGTGVIRRHPDIKWLRRPTDIPLLAREQLHLLTALWPLLARGGVLIYATCSILRAEGEDVVRAFLKATPSAKHVPIAADWGMACRLGRRIAPGGDFDGFYYAKLVKP
ncbi:MAG: 16S rRNA (cytosine(967)-C(5))-methyltransferase RsmB [Stenotrophobium sp.]